MAQPCAGPGSLVPPRGSGPLPASTRDQRRTRRVVRSWEQSRVAARGAARYMPSARVFSRRDIHWPLSGSGDILIPVPASRRALCSAVSHDNRTIRIPAFPFTASAAFRTDTSQSTRALIQKHPSLSLFLLSLFSSCLNKH